MTTPDSSPATPAPEDTWLTEGKWHLVSVISWGREAFCAQLTIVSEQQTPAQTGILRFEPCVSDDFAGFVLVQVADMGLAQHCLRQVMHFQAIERRPMKLADVKRMLAL